MLIIKNKERTINTLRKNTIDYIKKISLEKKRFSFLYEQCKQIKLLFWKNVLHEI
jgi:hypothetical protein